MAKEIVTLLPGEGRQNGYIPVVIADTETESAIADLAGFAVLGLLIPTIDDCNITFLVNNLSTGTFRTLKRNVLADDTMTNVLLKVGTGNMAVSSVSLEHLKGWRFVKIKTSAAQNGGPHTLIWIVKG